MVGETWMREWNMKEEMDNESGGNYGGGGTKWWRNKGDGERKRRLDEAGETRNKKRVINSNG